MKEWFKGFVKRHNDQAAILRQDISRLNRPEARPDKPEEHEAGLGLGVSDLTGVMMNLAAGRFKQGLQLADGADRGKVSIVFQYLGIGAQVVGSGANVTYIADVAVAGVNGLDTGSEAANTWYHVYIIIGDDTGEVLDSTGNNNQPPHWRRGAKVASLLSTSATAPTLPPGFNRFRRVGAVFNNSSGDLYRFIHSADSDLITWNEALAASPFRVLNVTTSAGQTYTDVACSGCVPSTSRKIVVCVSVSDTPASTIQVKNKDAGNITYSASLFSAWAPGLGSGFGTHDVGCDASQVIQYATDATTNDAVIIVRGYYDAT